MKQIIIAQRGWVFVGDVERSGDEVTITNAHCIRRWGTTKGLEWSKATLVPEVIAQLEAGKRGMVEQAEVVSNGIATALGEALLTQVRKALESTYTTREIAEKLFRGY